MKKILVFMILVFVFSKVRVYADGLTRSPKVLKFDLLAPFGDRVAFSFEKQRKPNKSYELGINVIGIGHRYGVITPVGITVNAGYKFYLKKEEQLSTAINGFYIQPQLMIGETRGCMVSQVHPDWPPYDIRYINEYFTTAYLAGFINVGNQMRLNKHFVLDISTGLGSGLYSSNSVYKQAAYNDMIHVYDKKDAMRYGFGIGDSKFPMALSFGLKLGYVFQ